MFSFPRNTLASLALVSITLAAFAQQGKSINPIEVRGSGMVVQEQRAVKPFNNLEIEYTVGKIVIEVGNTTSTTLEAHLDDNLRDLLVVEEVGDTLKLSFRNKQGVPVWAVDASVAINIKAHLLRGLVYKANSTVSVSGLSGGAFFLNNKANGKVTLQGKVDSLAIVSMANGSIEAEKLVVRRAKVVVMANATVRVNAKEINVVKAGNGSVINVVEEP